MNTDTQGERWELPWDEVKGIEVILTSKEEGVRRGFEGDSFPHWFQKQKTGYLFDLIRKRVPTKKGVERDRLAKPGVAEGGEKIQKKNQKRSGRGAV